MGHLGLPKNIKEQVNIRNKILYVLLHAICLRIDKDIDIEINQVQTIWPISTSPYAHFSTYDFLPQSEGDPLNM